MIQSAHRFWKVLVLAGLLAFNAPEASSRDFAVDYSDLTPAALKTALTQNVKGYRTGIALSGGGARGFAHLGVLEELERSGVEIDVVAGTSMGGIIGGLYAAGYVLDTLHISGAAAGLGAVTKTISRRSARIFSPRRSCTARHA